MNVQFELIPGIYNYCDSWCERCLFTARCRSFQLQASSDSVKPVNSEEALVQQLTEALNLTKQYLDKMRQTKSLSGSDAPTYTMQQTLEEQAVKHHNGHQSQLTHDHPVAVLANEYLRQTGTWFKDEANLLEQAGKQQLREVEMGIRTQEQALVLLNELKDAWEMIRWYRTLIPVKTMSALRAVTESAVDPHLYAYHLGKAKLVLVSIDRSLLAWQTMINHYPEKTDDLLDLLALLSRMRREMETALPEARAFQRPGLD